MHDGRIYQLSRHREIIDGDFFSLCFFFKDSLKQDDTQVEHLNSDLQLQVKNLVFALRDITKRERQQVIERVHQDCSRVKEDMSQTLSIQHYLSSLLAESDPFLLIWVRLQNIIKKQSIDRALIDVGTDGCCVNYSITSTLKLLTFESKLVFAEIIRKENWMLLID